MKDIKWAVLGTGVIANEMAQALIKKGKSIYSVANRTHQKAVEFAKVILVNHFNAVAGVLRAAELVKADMEKCDGEILILSKFVPWKSVVIDSGYKYVVYPSNRGGYSIQGVPVSTEDNTLICDFPKSWCGKEADELRKISGIKTLRFCHPNGFLAAAETLEDAVKAAKLSLEIGIGGINILTQE